MRSLSLQVSKSSFCTSFVQCDQKRSISVLFTTFCFVHVVLSFLLGDANLSISAMLKTTDPNDSNVDAVVVERGWCS